VRQVKALQVFNPYKGDYKLSATKRNEKIRALS